MKLRIFFLAICFAQILHAQSYQISTFNTPYDTLTNYNSNYLDSFLIGGDDYEYELDFGFLFPFYGNTYSNIIINTSGYAYFNQDNAEMSLFDGSFTLGPPASLTYVPSDLRFEQTQLDGINVLIVEWHHVYNSYEGFTSDNHYVNFEVYFFENGIIDVRFGDIDLENCSTYLPGYGFSFDPLNPTNNIYGPWMYIVNDGETESASFFNNHLNPTILYDDVNNNSVLTSIPEEGFVVRYTPSAIVGINENITINKSFEIIHHDGYATISGDLSKFKEYNLYSISGKFIANSKTEKIDFSNIASQLYVVEVIKHNDAREAYKLMVVK